MKHANTYLEGKNKRTASFILPLALILLLGFPVRGQAGIWNEDVGGNIDQIISNVQAIKAQMKEVFDTIKDATKEINNGQIKDMIDDTRDMLTEAVKNQQDGVNDFLMGGDCVVNDGTPCGFFRADLLFFLQTVEDINNQLLAMHNIPGLDLQLEDPGLANLINKIPGRILYPLYRVITKTKLLDANFLAALADLPTHLANLKLVLFPDPFASPTSLSTLTAASQLSVAVTVPTASRACQIIDAHPLLYNIASTSLNSLGTILQITGSIMKAMGKTAIVGPKEVDAGIHGYVHGTLATDHVGATGEIVSIVGTTLSALGNAASSKISSCGVEARQIQLMRGQKEILCATKNNNLSPYCDEFVGNGFDNHGVGGNQGGNSGGGNNP